MYDWSKSVNFSKSIKAVKLPVLNFYSLVTVEQEIFEMAQVGFADKLDKKPINQSTNINLRVQLEKSECFPHEKYN